MSPLCPNCIIPDLNCDLKEKQKLWERHVHFSKRLLFLPFCPSSPISDDLISEQSCWSHGVPIECATSGKVKLAE